MKDNESNYIDRLRRFLLPRRLAFYSVVWLLLALFVVPFAYDRGARLYTASVEYAYQRLNVAISQAPVLTTVIEKDPTIQGGPNGQAKPMTRELLWQIWQLLGIIENDVAPGDIDPKFRSAHGIGGSNDSGENPGVKTDVPGVELLVRLAAKVGRDGPLDEQEIAAAKRHLVQLVARAPYALDDYTECIASEDLWRSSPGEPLPKGHVDDYSGPLSLSQWQKVYDTAAPFSFSEVTAFLQASSDKIEHEPACQYPAGPSQAYRVPWRAEAYWGTSYPDRSVLDTLFEHFSVQEHYTAQAVDDEEILEERRQLTEYARQLLVLIEEDAEVTKSRYHVSIVFGPEQWVMWIFLCLIGYLLLAHLLTVVSCSGILAALRRQPDDPLVTGMPSDEKVKSSVRGQLWPIRWLIAALPSVGFIGTVRGMSGALADADAIVKARTAVEQAFAISNVASTLALAFTTTLVALVFALIASLAYELVMAAERMVFESRWFEWKPCNETDDAAVETADASHEEAPAAEGTLASVESESQDDDSKAEEEA
ncbi:MotA/TolQ/ExbB proton channel family protein [Persicimonas caeni]|uniref:MotA/TolQ/ExbB proton channel family protein n=1 Tax=Persicimonas caeni TaxID=2292766 RepID=A0A4Y6PSP6_PERCE|nr:MotA/TolQ/ExbB proton channel family protein [Persicimonas caeni]QDG51139.1 MotA/TolQ/ExbB proton channel family protein [Persicimonas caeni]QED32360.1 MotA/TolQ/ExbB proton channel family protein [Persicimonas caeni]